MRKGELLALHKEDVDLGAGTLRVGRSHASDTTRSASTICGTGLQPCCSRRAFRWPPCSASSGASDPAITTQVYGHPDLDDMR